MGGQWNLIGFNGSLMEFNGIDGMGQSNNANWKILNEM
jgi:hypothetical protein